MEIWKYSLKLDGENIVSIPQGAQILSAGIDPQGHLCVWAIVHPERSKEARSIYIRGTGNPFSGEEGRFIGTVRDGLYMWHVFQDQKPDRDELMLQQIQQAKEVSARGGLKIDGLSSKRI